ncbi:microtubule-associated protein futsch isoform X1 [Sergentomyia squamirostris]
MGISTTTSDFNQWLHAMKMVARLPGGIPPEFRKKLWISLADQYLQTKHIDWTKEEEKCFSDSGIDDEELGAQIVKDLHRTGSSLCSGPAGSHNQAKLKRVLLGYSRWNPSVGYCQGFNMLGALILQVLDKNEGDSIKVMIYLIEGVLPAKYFCDSLNGLQTDMAVFRDLLSTRLPRLSKHLYKLQGSVGEEAFEPPLTNVFTMQWFLTLFCTCLPISSVLRIWDLILIEGSDILLRTGLAIWTFLEERIISAKTADDFYCKMGTLSSELLNGNLIDSNGLVQRVVDLGSIEDLQQLREKHVYNVANFKDNRKGYKLFYSDDEGDSDDDSRMAVATAWGLRMGGRRESMPGSQRPSSDNRDKMVLDINLLKHQYERLRERQRQAQIILTAACARQPTNTSTASSFQVNQLLFGRNAILSNKGRRIGPPQGAIPPPRRSSATTKSRNSPKTSKRDETLLWKDTDVAKARRNNLKWKDTIQLDETVSKPEETTEDELSSNHSTSRHRRRSESSSYSEDSSTSTSLCDDDDDNTSSFDVSPFKKKVSPDIKVPTENKAEDIQKYIRGLEDDSEITCTVDFFDNPTETIFPNLEKKSETITKIYSDGNTIPLVIETNNSSQPRDFVQPIDMSAITSTSQLSPIGDFSGYLSTSCISPLRTPSCTFEFSDFLTNISREPSPEHKSSSSGYPTDKNRIGFDEMGITNKFFERINSMDRPKKLDLDDFKIKTPLYSASIDVPFDQSTSDRESFRSYSLDPSDLYRDSSPLDSTVLRKLSQTIQNFTTVSPGDNMVCEPVEHDSSTQLYQSNSDQLLSASSILLAKQVSIEHIYEGPKFELEPKEQSKDFVLEDTEESVSLNPSSSTENLAEHSSNRRNSDRALKIIQENSLILHRLLKKNATDCDTKTEIQDNLNVSLISNESLSGEISPAAPIYTEETQQEQIPLSENSPVRTEDTDITKLTEENVSSSPVYTKSKINFLELDSPQYKRPDSLDESNITNISETLTSIENTIKSINSLCQDRDSLTSSNRRSRLMEEIEEIIKTSDPKDLEEHRLRNASSNSKAINISPTYGSKDISSFLSNDNSVPYRGSRDLSRATSPRRRRDEEREEYESRMTRVTPPSITKTLVEPESSSNYKIYSSSLGRKYPDKLEIRHTTVTATLYDRYLSQRNEKSTKLDKSPSSPVITKNYSDYLSTGTADRITKSAETSPSRYKTLGILPSYSDGTSSTSPSSLLASKPTTEYKTLSPLEFTLSKTPNDISHR